MRRAPADPASTKKPLDSSWLDTKLKALGSMTNKLFSLNQARTTSSLSRKMSIISSPSNDSGSSFTESRSAILLRMDDLVKWGSKITSTRATSGNSATSCRESLDCIDFIRFPPFDSVNPEDRIDLLCLKLKQCHTVYSFEYDIAERHKRHKENTLIEIQHFIENNPSLITPTAYRHIIDMFKANVIRPLFKAPINLSTEEEEPYYDPAWRHLRLVYTIMQKFMEIPDLKIPEMTKAMDRRLFCSILDMLDSEDPRERNALKLILHRAYARLIKHRTTIRKETINVLARFNFEQERYNGVAEILEIFGSIISGFQVPLKKDHLNLFYHCLLPLHKPREASEYYSHLSTCIIEFVEKDTSLLISAIKKGILSHWPRFGSTKQSFMLSELAELMQLAPDVKMLEPVRKSILHRVGKCAVSSHFQLSEQSLVLWKKEYFLALIRVNYDEALAILFPYLEECSKDHWCSDIREGAFTALRTMMDMNNSKFKSFADGYITMLTQKVKKKEDKEKRWKLITKQAISNCSKIAKKYPTEAKAYEAMLRNCDK